MINSLTLLTPSAILTELTSYNLDTSSDTFCSFQDESGNLVLRPSEYVPTNAGEVTVSEGFTSARVLASARAIEIEIAIPDGRQELLDAVMLFKNYSANTIPGVELPLTLRDYIRPERVDRGTGYTDRVGFITEIAPEGGITIRNETSSTSRRFAPGFRIRFKERDRRRTY